MRNFIKFTFVASLAICSAFPDKTLEADYQEEQEEKRPYHFYYTASRSYNSLPDREHQEERGIDGITRGVYRFVDPRLQIQEVVYTSDDDGFHVQASNLPQYTPVVKAARQRHADLFNRIKEEHARIGEELEEQRKIDEEEEIRRALEEGESEDY